MRCVAVAVVIAPPSSVDAATVRPRGTRVLDEWELRVGDAAGVRQEPRLELAGREAGELAEVAVEVRLVVVAAGERDLGEAPSPADRPRGALEAQQPRDGLRR